MGSSSSKFNIDIFTTDHSVLHNAFEINLHINNVITKLNYCYNPSQEPTQIERFVAQLKDMRLNKRNEAELIPNEFLQGEHLRIYREDYQDFATFYNKVEITTNPDKINELVHEEQAIPEKKMGYIISINKGKHNIGIHQHMQLNAEHIIRRIEEIFEKIIAEIKNPY